MAATLNDLTKLKQRVETARNESARAAGALSSVMDRIRKEFGCKTLDEAKALLKRLARDHTAAEAKFTEALEKFEAEFGDQL